METVNFNLNISNEPCQWRNTDYLVILNPYFALTLQTGQYTIFVTTTTNSPVSSILNIQSKARTAGQPVITANSWLSDDIHIYGPESRTIVYVSVLKGMSPVINTDVFVNIDSYGKFTSLQLHDNGIGN